MTEQPNRPSRSRTLWRLLRRTLVVCGVFAVVGGVSGYIWFSRTILTGLPEDLTEYRDWVPLTNVTVLDAQGIEVDRFYVERREWVALDTLPDHVWQAFVAAEDRRFFKHRGVDAFGIVRALLTNATSGKTRSGASTLTQQLVKNLLVGSERSYERKAKEAVLAYRLERDVGKRRILELYLNYVALGSGNYGVEAASRDYFGIPAAELDVAQAALIAGLVPAPSKYSPRRWPEASKQRRGLVLGRMVRAGYLTVDEAQPFYDSPIEVKSREEPVAEVNAAYLTEVRREIRRTFGNEAPFQRGFTVWTPLRTDLQQVAMAAVDEAIQAHLERQGPRGVIAVDPATPADSDEPCFPGKVVLGGRQIRVATETRSWILDDPDQRVYDPEGARPLRNTLVEGARIRICPGAIEGHAALARDPWAQAAAIVIHHPTGEVVAVSGGNGVALEGFNRATQARRQPGSSFKPYVYAAALGDGLNQLSVVTDGPINLGGWSPKNYSGGYSGPMPLRSALARSVNTIAVRLTMQVGAARVAALAQALGVRTPLRNDPTIGLGSSEVTPLDQALAYTTLVRGGVPTDPVWVRQVATVDDGPTASAGGSLQLDGVAVHLPGGPEDRVLRPEVAYQIVDMLREVVRNGTARKAFDPHRDRGGKTGTTNDFLDAWFVGFTANHVVAVWIGTDGTLSLGDKETGGKAALPAWIKLAEAIDEPVDVYLQPPPEIGWKQYEGLQIALPWADHR